MNKLKLAFMEASVLISRDLSSAGGFCSFCGYIDSWLRRGFMSDGGQTADSINIGFRVISDITLQNMNRPCLLTEGITLIYRVLFQVSAEMHFLE